MDTIFALATAEGKAGVSIVRVSGPLAHGVAQRLCGTLPPPHAMALRNLRSQSGDLLDRGLVLRFDGPASFTGEDIVEFHLHGSTAIVASVLSALGKQDGARLAQPGEFTRRALENDKLDLSQVEGLADLIDAETETQRMQAQRIFDGALGDLVDNWRKDLIRAAALIEATIDFADEDVPTDVTPEVSALLSGVKGQIEGELMGSVMAERIRTGFEVAIIGAPNVGKSTLLNHLAGRDAAITSEHAGTTRDLIEVRMDLDGLPVTLLDTAGLRETDDVVEGIGIDRARRRAQQADMRIILREGVDLPVEHRAGDVALFPKADKRDDKKHAISGVTGEGVSDLIKTIGERLRARVQSAGTISRERHRMSLKDASDCLSEAQRILALGPDHYEVCAEEMRTAIRSLESLVGRVDVENLLDEIFSSFCLGK